MRPLLVRVSHMLHVCSCDVTPHEMRTVCERKKKDRERERDREVCWSSIPLASKGKAKELTNHRLAC